jgi:hypothetical protein
VLATKFQTHIKTDNTIFPYIISFKN